MLKDEQEFCCWINVGGEWREINHIKRSSNLDYTLAALKSEYEFSYSRTLKGVAKDLMITSGETGQEVWPLRLEWRRGF